MRVPTCATRYRGGRLDAAAVDPIERRSSVTGHARDRHVRAGLDRTRSRHADDAVVAADNSEEDPQVVHLSRSGDLVDHVTLDVDNAAIETNQIFDVPVTVMWGPTWRPATRCRA